MGVVSALKVQGISPDAVGVSFFLISMINAALPSQLVREWINYLTCNNNHDKLTVTYSIFSEWIRKRLHEFSEVKVNRKHDAPASNKGGRTLFTSTKIKKTPVVKKYNNTVDSRHRIVLTANKNKNRADNSFKKPVRNNNNNFKKKNAARENNTGGIECGLCSKNHSIKNCDKFKSLSPKERFEALKRVKACLKCFSMKHNTLSCPTDSKCSVANCKAPKYHNTMLHMKHQN